MTICDHEASWFKTSDTLSRLLLTHSANSLRVGDEPLLHCGLRNASNLPGCNSNFWERCAILVAKFITVLDDLLFTVNAIHRNDILFLMPGRSTKKDWNTVSRVEQ